MYIRTFFLLPLLLLFACKEPPVPIPPAQPPVAKEDGVVAVYQTNHGGTLGLVQASDSLPLITPKGKGIPITINPTQVFQEMEGFGAALTESSAYVLNAHLSASERTALLQNLFQPTEGGIGISYLRITMGASDFSLANYTYHDLPHGQTDPSLASFSLGNDTQHLIPVLKEILAIAPDLQLMATPWTAPAWMKTNQSLLDGGKLKPEYYAAYAQYFVKYLQAMEQAGIPIASLTIQNEPLHQAGYPSLRMSAAEQLVFIRDHLGPAFDQEGLDTKVIVYDHNWDEIVYPLEILNDTLAKRFVWGTAFHCYGGRVEAMSQLREAHPDKGIYFTECSGGEWATNFGDNLAWNMENLFVGATRNWAKTVLLWNLALDEKNGPQNGGCTDCRGVVTVHTNGTIARNVEYYLLGHMARFVRPGACRVETPSTRHEGISQVAFQNQDQSLVLVLYNHLESSQEIEVLVPGEKAFQYIVPAGSLLTFSWE